MKKRKLKLFCICLLALVISFSSNFTFCFAEEATTKASSSVSVSDKELKVDDSDADIYWIHGKSYDLKSVSTFKALSKLYLRTTYFAYGGLGNIVSATNLFTVDTSGKIWTIFKGAYANISAIGGGLVVLWMLIDLADKASMQMANGEYLIKLFIKMALAAVMISEGDEIAEKLIELANGLATMMVTSFSGNGGGVTAAVDEAYAYLCQAGVNWLSILVQMTEFLIPCICALVGFIVMMGLLIGRVIELGFRFLLFPIGSADIFTHGLAGPGARYMKKLVACGVRGGAVYIIFAIGNVISLNPESLFASSSSAGVTVFFESLTYIWQIVITFTTIGAMLKVNHVLDDVFM